MTDPKKREEIADQIRLSALGVSLDGPIGRQIAGGLGMPQPKAKSAAGGVRHSGPGPAQSSRWAGFSSEYERGWADCKLSTSVVHFNEVERLRDSLTDECARSAEWRRVALGLVVACSVLVCVVVMVLSIRVGGA